VPVGGKTAGVICPSKNKAPDGCRIRAAAATERAGFT
jgi:hypothetical protein